MRANRAARRGPAAGLCLLAVLAVTLPAPAQEAGGQRITLADLAPADTFAYVSFAGLEEAGRMAGDLGLMKLWEEPRVQSFFKDCISLYQDAARKIPEQEARQWAFTRDALDGRISMVVGGLTAFWAGSQGPIPLPGAVVSLDVGDQRQEFESLLQRALKELSEETGGISREQVEIAGHPVTVFKIPLPSRAFATRFAARHVPVHAAFVDGMFLAGFHEGYFARCLANLSEGGAGSLSASPAFRRARSKVQGTPVLELWLNPRELCGRVRGLIPDPFLEALHGLGLDSLGGVYMASSVDGDLGSDLLYVDAPAPRRGLVKALAEQQVSAEALNSVPDDAVFMAALAWNPRELWSPLRGTLGRFCEEVAPGGRLPDHLDRQLAAAAAEVGMSVPEALDALGGEIVLYARLSRISGFPKVAGTVVNENPRLTAKLLGRILEECHLDVRDTSYGDQVIHVVELPMRSNMSPAFAATDRGLVVALTTGAMRDALSPAERGGSLAGTADFKRVMDPMNGGHGCYVEYGDLKRLAAIGLDLAGELLPGLAPDDLPVDMMLLPGPDVLAKHLQGYGEVLHTDKDGVLWRARCPFGLGPLLALGAHFMESSRVCPGQAFERLWGGRHSRIRMSPPGGRMDGSEDEDRRPRRVGNGGADSGGTGSGR